MRFICPNCQKSNEINRLPATGGHFAVDCPYCSHGYSLHIDIQALPPDESIPTEDSPSTAMTLDHDARMAVLEGKPPASHLPVRIASSLAILLLVALLFLQQAYFRRHVLAQNEAYRPWLETLCRYTRCTLPQRHHPALYQISDPDIQENRKHEGVLTASVTISNQSKHPQIYPPLEIRFFDLNHQPVASRRFLPGEYLKPRPNISDLFPENSTIRIHLDIIDPGTSAISFEFTAL